MEILNDSMRAVFVYLERLFSDIINILKFLDFKKDLRIGLSQVGKIYIVRTLLSNALTFLCSNSTAEYFALEPPTFNRYLWESRGTVKV